MKGLILSAGLALGLGFGVAPASAAPLAPAGLVAAPSLVDQVACRTVTRQVRSNGVTRITKTQQCDRPVYGARRVYRDDRPVYGARRVYSERRVYRDDRRGYGDRRYYRDNRPGFSVRINP